MALVTILSVCTRSCGVLVEISPGGSKSIHFYLVECRATIFLQLQLNSLHIGENSFPERCR